MQSDHEPRSQRQTGVSQAALRGQAPLTSRRESGRAAGGRSSTGGRSRRDRLSLIVVLAGPFVVYQIAFRRLGLSEVASLLLAGGVPMIATALSVARQRRVDAVAGIVFTVFGARLVVAAIGGGPKLVLLADSFMVGSVSAVLFVSLLVGRPLAFPVGRRLAAALGDGKLEAFAAAERTAQWQRRGRTITAVWAVVLACLAIVHAALVFALPASKVVGISPALHIVVIAAAGAWTLRYLRVRPTRGRP